MPRSLGDKLLALLHRLTARLPVRRRDAQGALLEQPWAQQWDWVPKRSAGHDFRREDYVLAQRRAREVARLTIGDDLHATLEQQGYLDYPSVHYPGVRYRLRLGRRIEVVCDPGVTSPWTFSYLCVNPAYPLPEEEFLAQLFLYLRDREDDVIRIAAPQPWDQRLGRTF